jgi:RNA polymerase sigma-70 factor (ECF subfamily)
MLRDGLPKLQRDAPATEPPGRDGVPFACVTAAWNTHEAELLGYLAHRLGDKHAAEDLLQDVFVKAMRQGAAFCTLEQPRAWLFQVARNVLVDHFRALRPTEELPDDLIAPESEVAPIDALTQCIDRVLPRLGAEDQDILRECDLRGVLQQTFAQSRGLTLPATKARLRRARQRLRGLLVESCGVKFDADDRICCSNAKAPRQGP